MKDCIKASIIIPAFNEEEHIEKALLSIKRSNYPKESYEIIVVDNNSTDNTLRIAQHIADKSYILKEGNVGAVRNLGAKNASNSILIFLDADCLIDEDWLRNILLDVDSSPDLVIGGTYRIRENANWIERFWLLESPSRPKIQKHLVGGCICIKKQHFDDVGGFDEKMTSGEDSDLTDKLRSKGIKVKVTKDFQVTHLGNPTNISDFIKRQIWHSENYLQYPRKSATDATFWLTAAFTASIASLITSPIIPGNTALTSGLSLLAILIITAIASAKRCYNYRFSTKKISHYLPIYALDFFYLAGRSLGTLKSATKLLSRVLTPQSSH